MKYKLINTNRTTASIALAGNSEPIKIEPGESNALHLGELKPEQVVAYQQLTRIGVLLRKDEPIKKPKKPVSKDPHKDEPQPTPKTTTPSKEEYLKGRKVEELTNDEIKELYTVLNLPQPRPSTRKDCVTAIEEA